MPQKPSQNRIKRPPVVVVMGHIDHGKSTLLDYIRKANVVASEAGGITQHVGAYEAEHVSSDGKKHPITFLDTPGHEAFGAIRIRGAQAADIAILVVSAEDGVKPQTMEAYREIKAAKIPFIVAINKIDKPNADLNMAKQTLGEHEIYLEGWGGDIPNVAISALKGTGVSELLDMVVLLAELGDYTTDPSKPAEGIVIESELDSRMGIGATLLIKYGTLETGTFVVDLNTYSPVRFIENFKGEKIKSAKASMPVRIVGWSEIPVCGTKFITINLKKKAEEMVREYVENLKIEKNREAAILTKKAADQRALLNAEDGKNATDQDEESKIIELPLVVKADVIGSLEGIKYELAKITHEKVKIKIVAEGIGEINENDVKIALSDPEIIILGFNVGPDKKSASLIDRSNVKVKSFNIIYDLAEFVRATLVSKIPKEFVEESMGRAKILATFSKEKDRQVIGGKVETGLIGTGNEVKILRRNAEIGRGKIRELQEKKLRTSEVAEGHEFGVMVEAKVEIAVGDRIEAVRTVEKQA